MNYLMKYVIPSFGMGLLFAIGMLLVYFCIKALDGDYGIVVDWIVLIVVLVVIIGCIAYLMTHP